MTQEDSIAFAERDVRRLKRAVGRFRSLDRRARSLPPSATVTRIHGEPVVGDLGEDVFARVGLNMQQLRVADAAQCLAEELRECRAS